MSNDIITFPAGLPGFESCRSFVLMAAPGTEFQCLSAVDGPAASFVVVDPRRVLPEFRCQLSDADRHSLQAGPDTTLLWLSMVMLEEGGAVTVNLRAPIVINPEKMLGQQVIPYQCIYPLRHVLLEAA
jgi:flagellar assembly factor FliW